MISLAIGIDIQLLHLHFDPSASNINFGDKFIDILVFVIGGNFNDLKLVVMTKSMAKPIKSLKHIRQKDILQKLWGRNN